MRAAVLFEAGGDFEIVDVELADPGPNDVVVKIEACGLCASDLSYTTTFKQPVPTVMGHEGAGVVERVGKDVTQVKEGDRVVVLWVPACGHCTACMRGDEYLCENRKSSADTRAGHKHVPKITYEGDEVHQGLRTATFAEYSLVPENAVLKIEDDVPFHVASMMGCAIPTGVGAAMRSANVRAGERVAIIGCGAIGLSALLGAKIAGASDIIAVDPMETRRQQALALGASAAMSPGEFIEEPRNMDKIVDAVGAPATVRMGYDGIRRGGTVTVVGAGSPEVKIEFNGYELFHDDKRITGSFHGGISMRRDLPMLTNLWRTGRLPVESLMTGTAKLEDLNDVKAKQQSGEVVRTPILLG